MNLTQRVKSGHILINSNTLVFGAFILVYGMFAWGPKFDTLIDSNIKRNLYALLFHATLVFSLILLGRYVKQRAFDIKIYYSELIACFLGALLFFLTHREFLDLQLSGDELFHAQSAIVHSNSVNNLIINRFGLDIFENSDFRIWLSIIQVVLILSILVCTRVIIRTNYQIVRVVIITLIAVLSINFVGFGYKYPSGYIIPQFFVSSVSITTFGFRFIQVFLFMLIIVVALRASSFKYSNIRNCILALTVFWIPVVANAVIQIEQAVYFGLLSGVLLFLISRREKKIDENTILTFLSLLIFCRTTSTILIPVVCISLFLDRRLNLRNWLKTPLVSCIPIIFVIATEVFFSAKSTNPSVEISPYTNELNKISALWQSIISEFDVASLVILILSFCYLVVSQQSRMVALSYITMISTVYAFQIPNTVIGHNKYALEAFAPIIIFAILQLVTDASRIEKFRFGFIGLSFLIVVYFVSIWKHPIVNDESLEDWNQVKTFINYPVANSVEKEVLRKLMDYECVNLGSTYGNFNYIINGVSFVEYEKLNDRELSDIDSLDWGKGVKPNINLSGYQCVILDAYPAKREMRRLLIEQGFRVYFEKTGHFYATKSQIWGKDLN